MFNKFKEETKKVIVVAKNEMLDLKHPYLGSEHIMLGILKLDNNISRLLKKHNITYKKYKNELIKLLGVGKIREKWILYTPIVKEIIERAVEISIDDNTDVTIENLFTGLVEVGNGIARRIFNSLNYDIDKIYTELVFNNNKKVNKKKTLLEDLGIEYTNKDIVSRFDPVIGREKEIKQIIEILARKNKCNPLLIGEAGVGKSAIVEEISRLISINNVPSYLRNKRIISIDISSLVAGTKYRGEFEEKINKIIKEVESNDEIILFIDEIHTIVGAGGAEGAIDASNIFKPVLARGSIKCIGSTTLDEYNKYIAKDKALARRFKTVTIEEPSIDKVHDIIYKLKPIYEKYHRVYIDNIVLDNIINLTDKYIHINNNPDKTIDILDEVCVHASIKDNKYMKEYDILSNNLKEIMNNRKNKILNNKFKEALVLKEKENSTIARLNALELYISTEYYNKVTNKDLLYVLNNKVNTPIIELDNTFNRLKIIKKLHSTVIDQDKSIELLVNSFIDNIDIKHCFSVLLCGSNGVGKNLLASEFAKSINAKTIKLDMSEYNDSNSITKLLGSSPGYIGYDNSEIILDKVRHYPYTVIILDEIEKASKEILNIFLQVLKNNKIKTAKGDIIDFSNSIIIMTTSLEIDNQLGFVETNINRKLNDLFDEKFINGINKIIIMDKLKESSISKIAHKIIEKEYKSKSFDNEMLSYVINNSNYQKCGANRVKNLINEIIKYKKMKKIDKNYSKN